MSFYSSGGASLSQGASPIGMADKMYQIKRYDYEVSMEGLYYAALLHELL